MFVSYRQSLTLRRVGPRDLSRLTQAPALSRTINLPCGALYRVHLRSGAIIDSIEARAWTRLSQAWVKKVLIAGGRELRPRHSRQVKGYPVELVNACVGMSR